MRPVPRPEIRFRSVVHRVSSVSFVAGPRTDATAAVDDAPAVRLRRGPGRHRVAVGRRRVPQTHVPDTSAAPVAPPALSAAVHVRRRRRSSPAQRRRATGTIRASGPSVPAAAAAPPAPPSPSSAAAVALFVGAGAGPDHDPGPVPQPQRSPRPVGRDTAVAGQPTGFPSSAVAPAREHGINRPPARPLFYFLFVRREGTMAF